MQCEHCERPLPPTPAPLADVVRAHILSVYAATGCDKQKTAAVLKVCLKTLYNKLRLYGDAPAELERAAKKLP